MSRTKALIMVAAVSLALVCGFLIPMATGQAASKFRVLYAFHGKDGQSPSAGVIFDAAGNLYGTTTWGGNEASCYSCGTVFQLTPGANGKWAEKVLHSFNGKDGTDPFADLIFDDKGNLYGTTSGQGCCGPDIYGTVFRLAPGANGKWSETGLHSFNITDGEYPFAGVVFDAAGNLYGTTYIGGKGDCSDNGCGVVFKLAPGTGGKWSDTTIHAFNGKDGDFPTTGLISDQAGSFYGTASGGPGKGGLYGGVVFKLTLNANGKWTETLLHAFGKGEVLDPVALIFDRKGNLYGTGYAGGDYNECSDGCGSVFELIPGTNGRWTEKVLHIFHGYDGQTPVGALIFDTAGNLYGTTAQGGTRNDGIVFKLTPHVNGKWTEKVLHDFNGNDGAEPESGLISDGAGALYGTTFLGGNFSDCDNKSGCGVVFKITP